MRLVLHFLSSFVIFDTPGSTPRAGGADPCTTMKRKGMIVAPRRELIRDILELST